MQIYANLFSQVETSPGNEGVIYSISWAPADLNCIAGSTSRHGAFIWDIGKGKVIKRYTEVRTPFSLGIGTPVLDTLPNIKLSSTINSQ